MPELPEVQTTVNGLQSKVLNRTFVDVWSDWKKMVKKPAEFGAFKKAIKGKKIKRVWRRAKNVIFELSDDYSLLIHQKMTGHLMVGQWKLIGGAWKPVSSGPLEEKINTFLHMIFFLDDGKMIALSDVRKFAKIELWKTDELLTSKEFSNLGPEPLEKSFTYKKYQEAFDQLPPGKKGKNGTIKEVLMDPNVIAGIGNIYASEALWWSRIHPQRKVKTLSEKELKLLYNAIIKVLKDGVKFGGESFSDYRNVDGERGHFDGKRKAYQREKQPCARCKTLMARLQFGGRSAFYCPNCQKL